MGILMTIVAVMLGCGVFLFVECFSKTKRTGQIVATVILALATIGFGFLWMMLAVVGAFQAGHHENSAFPMVVYYSPLFITGLWFVNLIVFLITDNSIHDAAAKGNIEAVKQAIAGGVDVGVKNDWSDPPLHCAAGGGHMEVAELLLANGADVNAKNKDNRTPLDKTIQRNHTKTADFLRKHGGKRGAELKAEGK